MGMILDEATRSAIECHIIEHDMFWEFLDPQRNTKESLKEFLLRQSPSLGQIKNYIVKEKIDVVLSNCIVNVVPLLAAKTLGIPTLWLIHEIIYAFQGVAGSIRRKLVKFSKKKSDVEQDCLHFLGEMISEYSDTAIFNSETSRTRIFGPGSHNRTVLTIHPPIRREIFDAPYPCTTSFQDVPDSSLVVAFLGILVRHKGAHELIEAASRVLRKTDEVYFVIAGGSPDRSYHKHLLRVVRKMKMEGRVIFTGFLRDPLPLYDRADVICMTSLYEEPFGMVMTEAMSRGKTVLAYESGSVRETVDHGVNGYILPRGDIGALAEQIVFLQKHRNLLRKIGEQARKYSLEKYSPYRYQDEVESHLEQLFERRR
jgi:glycosyltransferase involved in cell wall biosynthesis